MAISPPTHLRMPERAQAVAGAQPRPGVPSPPAMQPDSRTASQNPLLPIPPQGFALPIVPPPGGDAMILRDNHLPVVISESEASGGKKLGSVRYVLSISLAIAFMAGVVIWNVFAK